MGRTEHAHQAAERPFLNPEPWLVAPDVSITITQTLNYRISRVLEVDKDKILCLWTTTLRLAYSRETAKGENDARAKSILWDNREQQKRWPPSNQARNEEEEAADENSKDRN